MPEQVPAGELIDRVARLQELLAAQGISLALIRQTADFFYYTGTVADGFLAVPATGVPVLLVRRPLARVAALDFPWEVVGYRDLGELPGRLQEGGLPLDGPVGLELDVLPAALYLRLREKVFPKAPCLDLSPLIRRQRMVKSPYEIEQIRRAGAILDEVYRSLPELLRPGLSELELSAALEYRLRLLGHQGLIRLRSATLEMFFGHVLSGAAGLEPAYTDTPSGGVGFSPAFPQGPSRKLLAPGEPVTLDIASCVNGYVADMTRLAVLGDLPRQAWQAYDLTLELFHLLEQKALPGIKPGELFQEIWEKVRLAGFAPYFMGPAGEQVSFLGHGVGLELDELPLLTAKFPYPLAADMVMAFEPKFFLPQVGMVGLEDTGRLTPQGVEWLTHTSRKVMMVKV